MSLNHEPNGNGSLPSIRFEDLTVNDMSDSSNRVYHKPPSEYEDVTWHLGWTDGRSGQPPSDNEAVLRARSRIAWRHRVAASEAEIEGARAVSNSSESILIRLLDRLERASGEHLKLLRERDDNPQSFSLSLWAIYSLAAVCLLAADLPLSLKLVAMGYGVTTENPMDARSVDNLLTDPWYVITNFWEAMLLALGVALSGIFIKYFLDALVYREEQKTVTKVFGGALLGLLTLFLVTTFLLGIFRADMQRQKNVAKLKDQLSTLEKRGGQQPPPLIADAIRETKANITKEEAEGALSVRTVSFIALTLLFPITGGVCFSVGWRKLIKVLRLRGAAKELAEAEAAFETGNARYEQARASLAALTKKLELARADYAVCDDNAELLVHLYRHGYMRGRNVPETIEAGASLYDRCEKAVARLLSGKMRSKYWSPGSTGPA